MNARTLLVAALLLAFVACRQSPRQSAPADYEKQIEAWHQKRIAALKADDGWLNLVGLYWLEPGENTFGADSSNDLVFPAKAAPHMGKFILRDTTVTLMVRPGVKILHDGKPVKTLRLADDMSGDPTILAYGSLRWYIIRRSDRFGVRLRDLESPEIAAFKGIERFPVDPAWRIEARFVKVDPPKILRIPTVIGTVLQEPAPGALEFEIEGKTYRLYPSGESEEHELFIVFGDLTNGKETYGGGRFLYVPQPDASGKTIIDFNKAYNPPCSFTAYATCPLPPEENKLPIRVTAGEKAYAGGPHHEFNP